MEIKKKSDRMWKISFRQFHKQNLTGKKIASFMENVGGGLTQSTKSLTEKVEENPNWGDLPVSQVDHRHRGSLEYQCSLCQVS